MPAARKSPPHYLVSASLPSRSAPVSAAESLRAQVVTFRPYLSAAAVMKA